MHAIREYTVVKNGQIVLNIPEYSEHLEVEVIVLPKKTTKPPLERTAFRRYDIRDLVRQMPKDYHPEEVSWGTPAGKEVW